MKHEELINSINNALRILKKWYSVKEILIYTHFLENIYVLVYLFT